MLVVNGKGKYDVTVPDGPKWAAQSGGGQWGERLSEGGMSCQSHHTRRP